MRDALHAQDQQLYFRVLTRVDLLLPVAAEAPGQAPVGWGTWTTGGRTHILAFTSVTALRACLGENAGATRRLPYADLAAGWPNHEWWLAVNPGLPIEGYLPAWYVAQLSRGDVRLPGRTMGARARLERVETAARLRAGTGTPGRAATPSSLPEAFAGRAPAAPVPSSSGGRTPATGDEPPTMPIPAPAAPPAAPRAAGRVGSAAVHRPAPAIDHPTPPNQRPGDDGPARDGWPARPHRTDSGGGTTGPAGDRPESGSDSLSGWLNDLRRRPDESDPFADAGRTGSANGRTGEPAPPPARSFFEPASGRASRRTPTPDPRRAGERAVSPSPDPALQSGERAVPPPRLGQGGQPFPRRRPLSEPVPERPTRPSGADPGEATQALHPETAWPFRSTPSPAAEATQALPRRHPVAGDGPGADERTQPIPPGANAFAPAGTGDLPPSITEPVSGPPPSHRGFKPIVIEGTVIESRDLTGPAEPTWDPPASGAPPEPYTVPTLPAASAMATATGSPHRTDGDEAGTPWAGPADPTMPITIDPPAEPNVPLFEAPAPPAEPTVPLVETPAPAASSAAPEPAVRAGPEPEPPVPAPPTPVPPDFVPSNGVEEELLTAAGSGSTDSFLSTLLLARVLLPVAADSVPGSRPGDPGFVWRTEQLDGETYVVVYSSPERLADRVDGPVDTVRVKFVQLIRRWPDESWSFAVNPGTPVGAKYPGEQVLALANWAAEVGLGDDPEGEPEQPPAEAEPTSVTRPAAPPVDPNLPVTMQKALAPSQLAYYLERGYDRVSGFVHRAGELAHLSTPAQLYDALGLGHPDSLFARDAEEIYVLRWPAYRPSLYRIPYGGQNEAAMRAMEGWVIERPPFRGNGFAPGESSDVVAEFKVDSARLPHGAQLCRIGADGSDRVVAALDTDALLWRQVGDP
ncbi:SseB family protein [Micromonospora sp. NPDC093277]|uniref:SseB family protein n=1 Tax=Micromonospora sp. NPDC093277 TaxID=3364291 RepID=UPI003829D0AD